MSGILRSQHVPVSLKDGHRIQFPERLHTSHDEVPFRNQYHRDRIRWDFLRLGAGQP